MEDDTLLLWSDYLAGVGPSPDPFAYGYPMATGWGSNSTGGLAWRGGNFGGYPTWESGAAAPDSGSVGGFLRSPLGHLLIGLAVGFVAGRKL